MPYIDGFLAAVPTGNKDAYKVFSEKAWPLFRGFGATGMWECWGDDVPDGKVTSFPMAVKLEPNETVVFSWIEWPDKTARNAGHEKMRNDPRMAEMGDMPFDGMRMVFGGFTVLMKV